MGTRSMLQTSCNRVGGCSACLHFCPNQFSTPFGRKAPARRHQRWGLHTGQWGRVAGIKQRESSKHRRKRGRQQCSSAAGNETARNTLQDLLAWLVANGVEGVGKADSKVGIYEGTDGERGLIFAEDVDEGVAFLSIPMRLAITDRTLKSPALADDDAPSDVRLASNLLAELKLGQASAWYPFLQALPKDVSSMYGSWTEAATGELQLSKRPRDMEHAFDAGQKLRADDETCKWALSVVNSRSFALPGGRSAEMATRFLLPLADMFNHGGEAAHFLLSGKSSSFENVRWEVGPSAAGQGLSFHCLTTRKVEEGEEALIKYGALSSWSCMLFYGFVPLRNAHDSVVLFEDLGQAVDWFLERFPPKADIDKRRTAAIEVGEKSSPPIADLLQDDMVAVTQHEAIVATARGGGDARLWDAFRYLTELSDVDASRMGSSGKVDRIIALRMAEILFMPKATSILTDLKLLTNSSGEDEEDRAHFAALLNYYTRVVSEFDEEFSGFKMLAKSLQPPEDSNSSDIGQSHFDQACHVALRFRASQKQVLWELMPALLK